ncbi:hypothetical protein SAMN05428960_0317 [Mitsuaria sp. PDC51]|uniref:TRAFAC clade GTPase domain-containing protein n=1 Tax=Mitsuaria sp. PDC51 TaxID=1881035 RepID=UPI0008ED0AEE|nr:hypothetical protein [Mitsuaria sp. PDC51]SFR71073.1 hypothetical protein SAMN05428960_0317 [Mitsuaria sp. PDC51]
MKHESVVVLGLPESGKTTFLAALWHQMKAGKVASKLSLVKLKAVESEHLQAIEALWVKAKKQDRTFHSKNRTAVMTLRTADGKDFDLAFPDIAGEAFGGIWEDRACSEEVIRALTASGVMLFVHSSEYNAPNWIADFSKLNAKTGGSFKVGEPVPWKPRLAPTQVQLVDLLRCLQEEPLHVGPRKLAVVLSAWDQASDEGRSPADYLEAHMPLLHQYLTHGLDEAWQFRVYGVSAQGGDYDNLGDETSAEAKRLQALRVPSHRIQVVHGDASSHDLSEPLVWLLEGIA